MTKFLANENFPLLSIKFLREIGHNVISAFRRCLEQKTERFWVEHVQRGVLFLPLIGIEEECASVHFRK
jgi:hypothetical protein